MAIEGMFVEIEAVAVVTRRARLTGRERDD